jgi:3',5'-nucleoside bisphosphate phosphatase
MARGSPFTELCQATARSSKVLVADLHTHSTASDGSFTPSQVVGRAAQEKLHLLALTDHDTFAGTEEAAKTLKQFSNTRLRLLPGVELSCLWNDREEHLLAYFPHGTTPEITEVCADLVHHRRLRFLDGADKLREAGHVVPQAAVDFIVKSTVSLGRRHLSQLVKRAGLASDGRTAWADILGPVFATVRPKKLLPMNEAIALVHRNRGFCSLAHPAEEITPADFLNLQQLGLDGVEVSFPAASVSRCKQLRTMCVAFKLLQTGGSDFHGPVGTRHVGDHGLTAEELSALPIPPAG